MKHGRRGLGIAESYRGDEGATSTLGGAVLRAEGTLEDVVFETCTVGSLDATAAVVDCFQRLDRPDVRYLFLSGVAPAWYNVLDLEAIATAVDRPVFAVGYEESPGLAAAIESAFDGEARHRRLRRYRSLPTRQRYSIDGRTVFCRSVGLDDDAENPKTILRAYAEDGRIEPLRVAKRVASRGDRFRRRISNA
ncbi:MAG: DUF99 family protein [Natronomonas sp.]